MCGTQARVSTLCVTGWASPQTFLRRIRRRLHGIWSFAFDGVELCGAFAANVAAGAAVNDDIERVIAAQDVLAQVSGFMGDGEFSFENLRTAFVGRTDKDDAPVRQGGISG